MSTITAGGININSTLGGELYVAALKKTTDRIIFRSLQNIGLFAARNSNVTDKTSQFTSGGAYYTGGINKSGNGVSVNVNNEKSHLATNSGIVSRLDSAQDISIYTHGDIIQQGAQHVAVSELLAEGKISLI